MPLGGIWWSLLPGWVVPHSGWITKLSQGGSLETTRLLWVQFSVDWQIVSFCLREVASRTQGKRSPIIRDQSVGATQRQCCQLFTTLSSPLCSTGYRDSSSLLGWHVWVYVHLQILGAFHEFAVPGKPNLTYQTAEAPARWAWRSASLYLALPPDLESFSEGVPSSYLCLDGHPQSRMLASKADLNNSFFASPCFFLLPSCTQP